MLEVQRGLVNYEMFWIGIVNSYLKISNETSYSI